MASYRSTETFSKSFQEAYVRVKSFLEQKVEEGTACYQIIATSKSNAGDKLRPCAMFVDKNNVMVYDGLTDKIYRAKEMETKLGISMAPSSKTNLVLCSDTVLKIEKAKEMLAMINILTEA